MRSLSPRTLALLALTTITQLPVEAKKIVFHEVEAESILYARSAPVVSGSSTSTNNSINGLSDKVKSISPFLSATLKTSLAPLQTTSLSSFNSVKQAQFSNAYMNFINHVLDDQQVYDVEVLSVNVFDVELLNGSGEVVEQSGRRELLTNGLQFTFDHDGDDSTEEEEEKNVLSNNSKVKANKHTKSITINTPSNDNSKIYTLQFSTVISAEHSPSLEDSSNNKYAALTNDNFQKILVHISHKFQSHLLEYVTGSDLYFGGVESVYVEPYGENAGNRNSNNGEANVEENVGGKQGLMSKIESEIMDNVSGSTLNAWSIAAIVIGGIVFVGLAFASVKFYR